MSEHITPITDATFEEEVLNSSTPVLVDYWAEWCGPCKAEIPSLKKVEKEYHGKNIEFISISVDKRADHEKWMNMVAEKELGGVQLFAENDWNSKFVQDYFYLQKIRDQEKINLKIELNNHEEGMIPPVSVQMLVENALKHNVSSRNNPLTVTIHYEGLDKLVGLVRTYFTLDGHHIQFNVVDAETLRAAQENPEQHRSLIVRVAGYSDYFCDLSKTLQDEIIARTEHESF